MFDKLTIGLIGGGAEVVAEWGALADLGVGGVLCSDPDPSVGQTTAAALGGRFVSLEDLLAERPAGVVVTLAQGNREHAVRRALDDGIHAIVAGRVAAQLADARELVRQADRSGLLLNHSCPELLMFAPTFQRAHAGDGIGAISDVNVRLMVDAPGEVDLFDGPGLRAVALLHAVLGREPVPVSMQRLGTSAFEIALGTDPKASVLMGTTPSKQRVEQVSVAIGGATATVVPQVSTHPADGVGRVSLNRRVEDDVVHTPWAELGTIADARRFQALYWLLSIVDAERFGPPQFDYLPPLLDGGAGLDACAVLDAAWHALSSGASEEPLRLA